MKVLHLTRYCHLDICRGTEIYILELILAGRAIGIEGSIAWLRVGGQSEILQDEENGIRVIALPCSPMPVDPAPANLEFCFLQCQGEDPLPDLFHFHTFGRTEAALAEWANNQGVPYVFTYHSPAWSCRRGDLLRWGRKICDGEVRSWRCSACMIQQRLNCTSSLAWAGTAIGAVLGLAGLFCRGSIRRRTAFLSDTTAYASALNCFLAEVDKVVACCDWSVPVLIRNGADDDKIVHCPQGVPMSFIKLIQASELNERKDPSLFTIGYAGRITWTKGVHILVQAFLQFEFPDARLRIIGWESEREDDTPYVRRLRKMIGNDRRIELIPPRSRDEMLHEYKQLDLLAIPSIWLETGPFTLLEAVQMGIRIYGSETVGQMQVLRQYGKVIRPNTSQAWVHALAEAINKHPGSIQSIPSRGFRTMQDVAFEMNRDVYSCLRFLPLSIKRAYTQSADLL